MIKKLVSEHKLIFIIILTYSIVFSIAGCMRHLTFRTAGLDFSLYDQPLWNTFRGQFLYSSLAAGGGDMFRDHFRPIFLFLIPLYFLFSTPLMLQVVHAVVLGLAALPLYLIAQKKLDSKNIAVILSLTFLFFPYLLRIWRYDFHPEVFYPLLILFGFYFSRERKFSLYFLFLFLTFMVKEDAFLYGIGMGIYIFFVDKNKKLALATIVSSVVYGFFALKIIPPYFVGSSGKSYPYMEIYSHLGNSGFEVMKNCFLKPGTVIKTLFNWPRLNSFFNLSGKVLFLPFLNLPTFFLVLVPLLELFLTTSSIRYGLGVYYSAPVLPFLFISVIFGLHKIQRISKIGKIRFNGEKIVLFISGFLLSGNFILSRPWKILAPKNFEITEHHRLGYKILKLIPPEASVCAQIDLYPHVACRDKIYLFPKFDKGKVNYIFLDTKSNKWPLSEEEYTTEVQSLLEDKIFETIFSEDGWCLLKKK